MTVTKVRRSARRARARWPGAARASPAPAPTSARRRSARSRWWRAAARCSAWRAPIPCAPITRRSPGWVRRRSKPRFAGSALLEIAPRRGFAAPGGTSTLRPASLAGTTPAGLRVRRALAGTLERMASLAAAWRRARQLAAARAAFSSTVAPAGGLSHSVSLVRREPETRLRDPVLKATHYAKRSGIQADPPGACRAPHGRARPASRRPRRGRCPYNAGGRQRRPTVRW